MFTSPLFRRFSLVLMIAALSFASGCGGKKVKEESTVDESPLANTMGDSDSGKAEGLQTIHFPYDSFTLTSDARSTLKANGDILKTKPKLTIQVEGHCDARGGIQYNIALGEKRANAVKKYLEDMGIKGDRITVISFGKEKLLDPGNTEEAHAKNRRANFVVTAR